MQKLMNMDLLKHHIELLIKKMHRVTDEIRYFTADEEDQFLVAQANEPLDEKGHFIDKKSYSKTQRRCINCSSIQKLI